MCKDIDYVSIITSITCYNVLSYNSTVDIDKYIYDVFIIND